MKTLIKKNLHYENTGKEASEYFIHEAFTFHEGHRYGCLGGYNPTPSPGASRNFIQAGNIDTLSSATDFGDLQQARHDYESWGNRIRIVTTDDGSSETAEFCNWSTFGTAVDWGEHASGDGFRSPMGDNVRTWLARHDGGGGDSTITVCTIMSGASADFGEAASGAHYAGGGTGTNGYRGVYLGYATPTASSDTIEYLTFASSGSGIDFGELVAVSGIGAHGAALTDGSRAMAVGDYRSDNAGSDMIQYVSVGTLGNASDYGEYHIKTALCGGASFSGRGMIAGGYQTTDGTIGEVGYFNIGVGGNGLDFGELDQTVYTPGTKSGG